MKDLKISNELISEILGKKVSMWGCDSIGGSVIEIGIHLPSGGRLYKQLNIYEFTSKCKEWAYNKNYYIYSTVCFAHEGASYITKDDNIDKRLKTFLADTEVETIIEACNWILENNK